MPTTRSFWSAAGERLHGLHSFLKYIMPTYSATNVMAVTCIQAKAAIIGKEKAKIRKRFPGFCDYCSWPFQDPILLLTEVFLDNFCRVLRIVVMLEV